MKIPFIVTATVPVLSLLSNPVKVWKNIPTMGVFLLTWDEVRTLRENPAITSIERDGKFAVQRTIEQPKNWGLDRIDQRALPLNTRYQSNKTGQGVDIYILDTGIDYSHPEFSGRAIPVWDYRAGFQIGNTVIHLALGMALPDIVQSINEQYQDNIASMEDSCLRLDNNYLPVMNLTGYFGNFLESVLGLPSGMSAPFLKGTKVNPVIDLASLPSYGQDDNGHGSHVAGIAGGETYGVAPSVTLKGVKAFSSSAEAQTSTLLSAMDFIIGNTSRPSVVNMSFGGLKSPAMDQVVLSMMGMGIVCCVAAGNSAVNAFNISPAGAGTQSSIIYQRDASGNLVLDGNGNPIPVDERYTFDINKPITVGAHDSSDQFAYFSNYSEDNFTLAGSGASNYGSVVDLSAPGMKVRSVMIGERKTNLGKILSGTSMATPHVAGVAALHLEAGIPASEVRNKIISDATVGAMSFTYAPPLSKDRTPNRILYMPYGEVNFFWQKTGLLISAYEGTDINTSIAAYSADTDGKALTVRYNVTSSAPTPGSVIPLGNGLTLQADTGTISGMMPSISVDQTYTYILWAIDDRGNALSGTFSIQNMRVNHIPSILTPAGSLGTFLEGDVVNITLLASDEDNDALTFSLLNGSIPAGLTLNSTGELSGIIASMNGGLVTHSFTVRVTDGIAVVDRTYDITVQESNQSPEWKSDWLPPLIFVSGHPVRSFGKFNIGDYVNIRLMAVDPDNDTLTWQLDEPSFTNPDDEFGRLPDGLTLKGNVITGTIKTSATTGKWFFDIIVNDAHHATGVRETFYMEVADLSATTQVITGITASPSHQILASILGGSRITGITVTVLSAFNGVNPRMSIGDTRDYARLIPMGTVDLTIPNTYHQVLNFKYNEVQNVNLGIAFMDDSSTPSYFVKLKQTRVDEIVLQTSGSGYTIAPTPVIQFGGGAGAKAITDLKAISVKIASRGNGYRVGDMIRILGGTTSPTQQQYGLTVHSVDRPVIIRVNTITNTGAIQSFSVVDNGTYLIAPSSPASTGGGIVTVNDTVTWGGANGVGATFDLDFGVKSIRVTDGGSGYLAPPTILFPGNGISTGSLQVEVSYIPSDLTVFFGNIKWETEGGYLGEIRETESSPYRVLARASGDSPVTYSLAPGSGPLPIGLTIDAATGDISGMCGFIPQDTLYAFTVRAAVGATFQDRSFSILLRSTFTTQPVTGLSMLMSGPDKTSFLTYCSKVPEEYLFRKDDPLFGIPSEPSLYVLFGLPDITPDQFWTAITGNPERPYEYDHHRDVNLCVGSLKYAHARDGNGNILYDVLYREVIDPLDRYYQRGAGTLHVHAGGWKGDNRDPVLVRDQYIYPNSITNMRKDLMARDTGGIGLAGQECMPRWMTSRQVAGDPMSVLGFTPAIVMAYLKPGTGADVVRSFSVRGITDTEMGTKLTFDRYFMIRYDSTQTRFDLDMLVPDPTTYTIVSTRDNDVNEQTYATPSSLYEYRDNDGNPLTPPTYDEAATLLSMTDRATQRAVDDGRTEPELTDDWRTSDYRPHENPLKGETLFDNGATIFDYTLYQTGMYFKFPPGDKR